MTTTNNTTASATASATATASDTDVRIHNESAYSGLFNSVSKSREKLLGLAISGEREFLAYLLDESEASADTDMTTVALVKFALNAPACVIADAKKKTKPATALIGTLNAIIKLHKIGVIMDAYAITAEAQDKLANAYREARANASE